MTRTLTGNRGLQIEEFKAQPAFEKYYGDGERDKREETFAEYPVRVYKACYRPGDKAEKEQKKNGRHLQAPREPLRKDSQDDYS